MSTSPNLNQTHFRFRSDTGAVEAAPTWIAAEDTNISLAVETTFRLRIAVQNTGTAASTNPTIIRVSKNAGTYTAVTTTSGATLGAQSADASTFDSDEASVVTLRLTAGTGSAAIFRYDENGSINGGFTNGTYTEAEFGLILKTAGAAGGDTFDFRVYNNTTAFTTYTRTPRVTVVDNNRALLANDVVSASSVTKPVVQQVHNPLANDVKSNSSVSTPTFAIIVPNDALLANDVKSASSVSQPAATILRGLLANDVKSNSTVTQPAIKALHGLLANDVKSNSSVGQPAAVIGRGLLANDVLSASSVSIPTLGVVGAAANITPRAMHQYRMRRAA